MTYLLSSAPTHVKSSDMKCLDYIFVAALIFDFIKRSFFKRSQFKYIFFLAFEKHSLFGSMYYYVPRLRQVSRSSRLRKCKQGMAAILLQSSNPSRSFSETDYDTYIRKLFIFIE